MSTYTDDIWGNIYRVCSDRRTAFDCYSQPLTINRVKINSLIRNRTITKRLSFYLKRIFDFSTMLCSTVLSFKVFDLLFEKMVETCTFTNFLHLLPKFILQIYFVVETRKHDADFSLLFSIIIDLTSKAR